MTTDAMRDVERFVCVCVCVCVCVAKLPCHPRYGEELLRLERITLNSIKQTAATIRAARGRPFNPQTCLEQLVFQILSILVRRADTVYPQGACRF